MTDDTKKPTIGFKTPKAERTEILQAENSDLQTKLAKAEKRIYELKIEIKNLQSQQKKERTHDTIPFRSNNDHDILKLLANQSIVPTEQIAETLHRNIEEVKYELTELSNIYFIKFHRPPISFGRQRGGQPGWTLDHAGRGYMVEHGLLQ